MMACEVSTLSSSPGCKHNRKNLDNMEEAGSMKHNYKAQKLIVREHSWNRDEYRFFHLSIYLMYMIPSILQLLHTSIYCNCVEEHALIFLLNKLVLRITFLFPCYIGETQKSLHKELLNATLQCLVIVSSSGVGKILIAW